ncbi:MAG TPA: methionyl-tRNA formyltransferase [Terriglobales bacterium]|jgi:methionyl-tRNA formyltransferase|nr:methionyl-tRNA formyltransferase [Terriglobales bacterium]
MKLIFCGTPQFAVPTLNALAQAGHEIALVVCQPDRPSGRGQQISIPAVKQRALELGLQATQPEKIKTNPEFQAQLQALKPQVIIVVAYGRIIPKWMLDLPPLGNLNLHASLLPKYRGAAPIQWAIASGEQITGATTMRIDEGLDTGDILLQREIPILESATAVTLSPRLAQAGAELMVETLRGLESNSIQPKPQDNSRATLAPILNKEDGRMDFSRPAEVLVNRLRGFQPWPGAFTSFRRKQLQITQAKAGEAYSIQIQFGELQSGELRVSQDRLLAGCGNNTVLEILELQPEGKKRISAREFINGYRPKDGEILGG